MSRTVFVVAAAVVLAAIGGAVAAPAARELAIGKLPWLSDAMKAPCDKTEFEYRLAAGRMDATPFKLSTEFDVVKIVPTVKESGLLVAVHVVRRPGVNLTPKSASWGKILEITSRYALDQAKARFGDKTAFEDWHHLYLCFFLDDQLIALRTFDYFKPVPPGASQGQQAELLAEMLTKG